MDPQRWAAVKALFDELVELGPDRQAERLAELDPTDHALRGQVEALLAADAQADERLRRLELPFSPPVPISDDTRQSGRLQIALADRYLIERELGRGGMATVYLAQDLRHERLVALKVLQPALAAGLGPERFLREIRTAAGLQHPHILAVHDSGTAELPGDPARLLWYTMPYVEGGTLRQRLAREPQLPLDYALRIALEVADALGHAHRHGVIHRDIKPENILLSESSSTSRATGQHCVVADFGVARALDAAGGQKRTAGGEKLTATGVAIGTPAYMSPEQATGDAHIDGRSDLYALGCVLYEMLAGEPPFTGRTVQAIIARRLSEPVPRLRMFRDVPEPIEQVVTRVLARSPADRFADAEQFVEALTAAAALASPARGSPARAAESPTASLPTASPPIQTRRGAHQRGALLTAGALVAIALAFVLSHRLGPAPAGTLDPDLLAVAPFDVLDPSLQLWREGLVDILSRDLDGAGPLRTVSQTVALKRWQGRADRPSAAALGERTGAGLVVFGTVVRKGADSVSLRAEVLDRARKATIPDLEVVGEERRMGELADSLGVGILRTLGGGRPIGSVRRVSIGSRSLPALKEFLRGEQFYRRSLWDSALVHYDHAVAQDSTFALALHRMSQVLGWGPPTSAAYRHMEEYDRMAVMFSHGLSPRDSLILASISEDLAVGEARDAAGLIRHQFQAVGTLEEAARRYPDDPEIWQDLGEHRYHDAAPLGRLPSPALQAFDRAIALDPGFAPAYEHTVELATQLGQPDLAKRYARAYMARGLADANAPALRLVALVFDSGVGAPAVAREVESASANTLFHTAVDHLKWWVDSAETAVVLLRALANGHHDIAGARPLVADSLMWPQYLAAALAFRGHLRAAAKADHRLLGDAGISHLSAAQDPFLDLALLGVIADSTSRRTFGKAVLPDAPWDEFLMPRYLRALPWWLSRGDSASLARFARRAAEVMGETESPIAMIRARYLSAAGKAYLSLARGDSAEAVRLFQAIPDTLCLEGNCFYEKLTLARLFAARGEDPRAAELLDRWVWSDESIPSLASTPSFVFAALERGRIAERLGDRGKALERYGFVANVWRRADPELQPYVEEAQAGLRRLAADRDR
jgi:eukaryotic-like serine/threonine-protein kinase